MLFGPSATEVVFNAPPILQNLEEFVVENLDPDGNTLNILPPSFRRLSILCSPRYTVVEAPVPLPDSLRFHEMLVNSSLSEDLQDLSFSIRGPIDSNLLVHIADRVPRLARLQIQRTAVGGLFTEAANSIGHALDKLKYLRALWLDIGHINNLGPGYNAIQPPLSTTTAARRWALDLAIAVSSLDRVAIPHLSGIEVVWLVSGIRRDPAGGPVAVMLVELLKYTGLYLALC